MRTHVKCAEQISPHIMRVTFTGDDLPKLKYLGFDQWFRLALPVHDGDRFDRLPSRFGWAGAIKYLTLPKESRPVIRNYTIRQYRPDPVELDVDFVLHGTAGVAGPWAAAATPGQPVALIDQGCGWDPAPAERHLIVADESGMPAALGILRDMPETPWEMPS